jgi:SAM-dependent methyltransferase
MLTTILHRLAANPQIYDLIQLMAGIQIVHRHLSLQMAAYVPSNSIILDCGGGTGLIRKLCPPDSRYVCLDMDAIKLGKFVSKNLAGKALFADTTQIPIKSGSVDNIMFVCVSHHLSDEMVEQMICESMRVLKPTGKLFFLDPVWAPSRLPGRLLWHYDRGSFPHSANLLKTMLTAHGNIVHWETFAVFHRYILCVLSQRS